jgi:hypothetical protein
VKIKTFVSNLDLIVKDEYAEGAIMLRGINWDKTSQNKLG